MEMSELDSVIGCDNESVWGDFLFLDRSGVLMLSSYWFGEIKEIIEHFLNFFNYICAF